MSSIDNIALDVALQKSVADGLRPAVMWMWDWAEPAVILGSFQSVANEIDTEELEQRGFTFARRMTGGGAMIVEPGKTITYSVIVPESLADGMSYRESFALFDRWAVQAFRSLGIPATYKPINDIASPVAKIGGAAQARRWGALLHHTTIAYDLREETLMSVLRLGRERMQTKGIPSAQKKVSPLNTFTDRTREDIQQYMMDAFADLYTCTPSEPAAEERTYASNLASEKLGTKEWLRRVE
ncbi:MAG: lipoate--protein ligase [Ectothiorhodospiraceae bacterium]|nr:lipoate--protein ligase [Ectothiorhodospiraceae bacterium]